MCEKPYRKIRHPRDDPEQTSLYDYEMKDSQKRMDEDVEENKEMYEALADSDDEDEEDDS